VGITLLASATLNETLEQIVSLVFESVPADRCLIMMRDEGSEDLRVAVARLRDRVGEVGEIRVSRNVLDEVVIRGKSVLTSDAQHDPRFASGTMVLQGVRSVLAVPLGVADKVFGIIYADSPIAEGRFTEDHLKVLTTLASVAAIRVENARLVEAFGARAVPVSLPDGVKDPADLARRPNGDRLFAEAICGASSRISELAHR